VSNARRGAARTETVEIVVNGQPRQAPAGLRLDALLEWLDVPLSRVAVERNRAIVRKADWGTTPVEAGDTLEIVWFVGGG
jgi:thiamine biosynthesis protein ThiS